MAAQLTRVCSKIEGLLGWILVGLMSVMVVDVTWQVVSRFVLRSPSSFTEELAGFLLIWIGLLGAAYGIRTKAHLGIDILVEQLRGGWRRGAETSAHFVVLLFALSTMVGGGTWLVRLAFRLDQTSAAMGIEMGFVYLAVPLSGALVVLFSAESMARTLAGSGSERAPMASDGEPAPRPARGKGVSGEEAGI
jgi:TRAP-type C4-dicarboxylate transport system permease small subunit